MAQEDLLRILHIHRNLLSPAVIARTMERAIHPEFFPLPPNVERDTAEAGCLYERRLCLQFIDVHITRFIQGERLEPCGEDVSVPFCRVQIDTLIYLSPRDRDLLLLLNRTPATPSLILKASATFAGEPFRDERRVRERLQQLTNEKMIRAWGMGQMNGGVTKVYKLTPQGFSTLYGEEVALPPKAFFAEIPLSRLAHTQNLAEVIVHTLVTAIQHRVQVTKFHRENELTLTAGQFTQQPDCHVQLRSGGKIFNVLFELDRSTESVDSHSEQSIRQKILGYEAYQDLVWQQWKCAGEHPPRPYFRVAFLTLSIERAYHILTLAGKLARNPERRLCYAATLDSYLAENDAIREPLFLDHQGGWQSLVNLHPTALIMRTKVRFPLRIEATPLL